MRLMIVTGAFATHTTKLYNYYVCPASWDVKDLTHIGVNFFNELKYLGIIKQGPFNWGFNEITQTINFGPDTNQIPDEVKNDLIKFKTLLNNGNHYLFLLSPILGGCEQVHFTYNGKGPFTQSHRYFPTIGDMMAAHQGITAEPNSWEETDGNPTGKNDYENQ